MNTPHTVNPPPDGFWRIGRSPDAHRWSRPDPVQTDEPGAGNRFDSFHGNFGVLYFATSVEACFAEVLARFRPNPRLADLVRATWREDNRMEPGSVAADWRNSRILVRSELDGGLPFLDVSHGDTLATIAEDLGIRGWLNAFRVDVVDLEALIGRDRRVTRAISQWASERMTDEGPSYSGIRYTSRLGHQYECWAVFEGSQLIELERPAVERSDEALEIVADRYNLTIH